MSAVLSQFPDTRAHYGHAAAAVVQGVEIIIMTAERRDLGPVFRLLTGRELDASKTSTAIIVKSNHFTEETE